MTTARKTKRRLPSAIRRAAILLCAVVSLVAVPISPFGQMLQGSNPLATDEAGADTVNGFGSRMIPGAETSQNTASENDTARQLTEADYSSQASTTLTANQIISLLREKPEAIVEAKQVMADFFLKRGIQVQVDSITDQILFSNIASNARLRQSISMWLRSRGYVLDEEFGQGAAGEDRYMPLSSAQDETAPAPDSRGLPAEGQLAMALRDLPPDSEVLPETEGAMAPQEQREAGIAMRSLQGRSRITDSETTQTRTSADARGLNGNMDEQPIADERTKSENASTVELLHADAPYNLEALRDLYTQVPEQKTDLKRFGSDVFLSRGLATREMPIDLPIGPDYVLGPGDGLTISLWGGVSQTFGQVIDREGRITLPEAGSLVVAGLSLASAEALVAGKLTPQFKNAHVTVSVSRLRTVHVYVVGDVQRPGAYDISSLSTPLNAIYAAGGPTSAGSLRTLRHMRGSIQVREIDLYDFLLHGVQSDVERLEPGDTILVPAVGQQVSVVGMVKRPALYEFKSGSAITLKEVLDDAGGLSVTAALPHIRVERVGQDGHRTTMQVGLPEGSTLESAQNALASFAVLDGDAVIVAPVLPYSEKAIYLTGHVVRPGKLPFHDGMKLTDAIRSYQDLLPEAADRGDLIRVTPPDLHPEAIEFSVHEVLAGNTQLSLQPFDTIHIRGRYDGDAPKVTVRGEVLRPGAYPMAEGMTAGQLVRIAGGFKRSALLRDADLVSYAVNNGDAVVTARRRVAIGEAVNAEDAAADVALTPGDVLTIRQVSGWNDIGASVTLAGEVTYPGTYGIEQGERLSSVLQRAGGFRATAYVDGAVLVRRQVKELEEKSRLELIRQMEATPVGGKLGLSATGSGDEAATLQLLVQQQNQALMQLRSQPLVGRLVIGISPDIGHWAGTESDVELRAGDVLTVPKTPGFVLVTGQVQNASAITFSAGKNAGWYLRRAGGVTEFANRKEIFVVRANGLVVGRRNGEWSHDDVLSTKLYPGDVVVVPQKIVGGSALWKNMLATAQVVSSIAFTAALALQ